MRRCIRDRSFSFWGQSARIDRRQRTQITQTMQTRNETRKKKTTKTTSRMKSLPVQVALLALLIGQLGASSEATSASYLDDYFSTAKYALNKLQQSLTSASGSALADGGANSNIPQAAAADKSTEATTTTTTTAPEAPETRTVVVVEATTAKTSKLTSVEPDKSEFVRVVDSSPHVDLTTIPTAQVDQQQATTLNSNPQQDNDNKSSTTENSEQPTTIVVSAATDDTSVGRAVDEGPSLVVVDKSASEEQVATSKLNEDSIKETELNAVAAVDLSIGFGNDLNMFNSDKEPCYDEYGNPRFCEPEFENVAFERQVEVSSECGSPASRFCTTSPSSASSESQIRNCHICDAQQAKKRHPAAYLTDLNNSNNPTCWVSAPIQAPPTNGTAADLRPDNVTLQVNLDKRYEILYVSMQFCSLKPDSLSIHKSNDFGQSWQAYQFYSSHCARLYNRQPAAGKPQLVSPTQAPATEASCNNISASGSSATRVAFSTLDGARVGSHLEKSPALQDWISATNIRITLDRHQAAWIQSTLAPHSRHPPAGESLLGAAKSSPANTTTATTETISGEQLTNPSSDTFNYALSDLTIGARCKCNGHASRCIHGKEGRLQCDCRHNTAGRDCEKCAPLHADRPWARATPTEANICQACNCNGHSRKCRFDAELYRLSGKRSGGVCLQCKDNTDGRHCHYCKEGWTRDHAKPMSDKEACKPCYCHPVGSLGRVCNQTGGQCPCKEGVTGLLCNRCAAGYQQSSSQSEPCIRIPPAPLAGGETNNEINNELTSTDATPAPADEQPALVVDQSAAAGGDTPMIIQESPPLPQPVVPQQQQPALQQQQQQQQHLPAYQQRQPSASWAPPGDLDARWQAEDQYWSSRQDEPNDETDRYLRSQYWPTGQRKKYYGAGRQYHRRPAHAPDNGNDELDDRLMDPALMNPPLYDQTEYTGVYTPTRQRPRYRQHYQQQQPHYRPQVAPIANLDPSDEVDPGDPQVNQYQGGIYSDESNQIPANHRRVLQPIYTTKPPASRRPSAAAAPPAGVANNHVHPIVNNIMTSSVGAGGGQQCGDCQSSSSRKLKVAKFCELEFAIRCSVLNKFVAEDWTKLDIEIQDIFKSPLAPLDSSGSKSPASEEAGMQQDAPVEQASNKTTNASDNEIAGPQHHHRLKVGTVQTIWVPTEDLACKCLRLKRGQTYLLMGTIDAKENSLNSLQLDRHGVAQLWNSNVQSRILKLQRKFARGSLCA